MPQEWDLKYNPIKFESKIATPLFPEVYTTDAHKHTGIVSINLGNETQINSEEIKLLFK